MRTYKCPSEIVLSYARDRDILLTALQESEMFSVKHPFLCGNIGRPGPSDQTRRPPMEDGGKDAVKIRPFVHDFTEIRKPSS